MVVPGGGVLVHTFQETAYYIGVIQGGNDVGQWEGADDSRQSESYTNCNLQRPHSHGGSKPVTVQLQTVHGGSYNVMFLQSMVKIPFM